jgi:hypothetical protein
MENNKVQNGNYFNSAKFTKKRNGRYTIELYGSVDATGKKLITMSFADAENIKAFKDWLNEQKI